MRPLIRGALMPSTECVCVLAFWFCVCGGVGCWNKAALCLVNLSHKCQLAVRCAIVTEMHTHTCNTCCIWPHCPIHTHTHICDTHTSLSPPRGLYFWLHQVPHTEARPPPDWMWWGVRGRRRGVTRGWERLLLPPSPPSLDLPRDRLMPATSFPACLVVACLGGSGPDAELFKTSCGH